MTAEPRTPGSRPERRVRGGRLLGARALGVVAVVTTLLAGHALASPLPDVTLWAWERPEDLRFLEPGEAGVAFLAGTLVVVDGRVEVRPRMQPLRVGAGIPLVAVVRVEVAAGVPDVDRAGDVARAIARLGSRPGLDGVQVDFDATRSQRAFHVALLHELRRCLRPDLRLEITALASWCLFDDWLADLPPGLVDGVVPMAFRMGADDRRVRAALDGCEPLRCEACRESLGIALDEPRPRVPLGSRVHAFSPRPWTRADVDRLRQEIERCDRPPSSSPSR